MHDQILVKEDLIVTNGKYGVITEQGYPAGDFGFDPVSEKAQKKLERDYGEFNEDYKEKETGDR